MKVSVTAILNELVYGAIRAGTAEFPGGDDAAELAVTAILLEFGNWRNVVACDPECLARVLRLLECDGELAHPICAALGLVLAKKPHRLPAKSFVTWTKRLPPAWARWVERRLFGGTLPLAIDLFAGGGGMSQGFSLAGAEVIAAVEHNKYAAATYRSNHPRSVVICRGIHQVSGDELLWRGGVEAKDVSVLFGGPPCQGFSESNRRTRDLTNPRNHLYKEVIRIAREIQPEWVVIENVVGLRTVANGHFLRRILRQLEFVGYPQANVWNLNAACYGVPQVRRRLFIIARKGGERLVTPKPTFGPDRPRPFRTVRDAILDLPTLRNGASRDTRPYRQVKTTSSYRRAVRGANAATTGHLVTRSSSLILRRYRQIASGQNWSALSAGLLKNYSDASRCHTGLYYRLRWDEPAKVVSNFRKSMLIHPSQNRGLSIREAARLQSFPDSYRFVGSIGFQQQQVADAVPPLLARAVARTVLSYRDLDAGGRA